MKRPSRGGAAAVWLALWLLLAGGAFVTAQPEGQEEAAEAEGLADEEADGQAQAEPPEDELSDQQIERRLRERLRNVEGLGRVTLAVEGGVALLSGEVEDSSARARAAEVAQNQQGVASVRNEIVLGGEVSAVIGNAFERTKLKLRMLLGYLPLFVAAVGIILISALLSRWLASPRVARRIVGKNRFLAEVVRQILRLAIVLVGLLIALDLLDATALAGAVFGAAGLAGLAVGFAFKDLIENYISSVLLGLRRPFMPNDHVVIDGHEGIVVSLNTRATTLMTLEGNHLRLPNFLVFKSVMLNYTRNSKRRFDFTLEVGVDEDLERIQRICVHTLKSLKGVLEEPAAMALVTDLREARISILCLAWIDQTQTNLGKIKGEAIRLVKLALEDEGVSLPGPTTRVELVREGEPASDPVSRRSSSTRNETRDQGDISVDDGLQQQVEEEKARNQERNLLTEETPPE